MLVLAALAVTIFYAHDLLYFEVVLAWACLIPILSNIALLLLDLFPRGGDAIAQSAAAHQSPRYCVGGHEPTQSHERYVPCNGQFLNYIYRWGRTMFAYFFLRGISHVVDSVFHSAATTCHYWGPCVTDTAQPAILLELLCILGAEGCFLSYNRGWPTVSLIQTKMEGNNSRFGWSGNNFKGMSENLRGIES